MSEYEIFAWIMAVTCVVSAPIIYVALKMVKQADNLKRMGWECVSCHMFSGPHMVPPTDCRHSSQRPTQPTGRKD